MMGVWFTSDLHFGHANILQHHPHRGESLDEMHARIVHGWNANVASGDEVWVLGDFYLGRKTDDVGAAGWFHALRGKKHLIVGNHDPGEVQRLPWTSVSFLQVMAERTYQPVDGHT